MKKRILTMAAALLTALTCVCACGGGETSQSQNSGNSAAEYDLEYAMAITSLEAGNEISPLIYGEFWSIFRAAYTASFGRKCWKTGNSIIPRERRDCPPGRRKAA